MQDKIEAIRHEITHHPSNKDLLAKGYHPLFSATPESKIIVIGQAPGIKAQEAMMTWQDASGKRLQQWFNVIPEQFFNPDNFAMIPMDFYYPGKGKSGDLPPRKEFAGMWHPQILELMPKAKLTILIGQYSQGFYLQDKKYKTLTETVRNYHEYLPNYFPLPHPSPRNGIWLRKNEWFEAEVIPDLQELISKIL